MRIAIVAGPYYPVPPKKYGGTERVIFYLIKGLKELGHEPILLGPGDSKVDCEIVPIVDRAIPFPKKDSVVFHESVAQALKKTATELQGLLDRVDIIHSHEFDLKDFQHFPNITTVHGHFSFENMSYFQQRKELPFVSISKNQQLSFPGLNFVSVVHNGEDPADFPVVTSPEDYFCFIGRFDWDKCPHLAVQLALSLGIKIKLAGKTDLLGTKYFREQIKPYLSNPLVEYLGELDTRAKIKLISKARCNLHPLLERREPFGLSVIEAAYCGTPTIAMSKSSMPEIIEDNKTGLLVEDFVEAYQKIDKCFALDRRYIANYSRKKFNYQKMTSQYIRAYRKVIGSKSWAGKVPKVKL